jgi:queuine tRNA-ribosyltransferase
VVFRSHIDGSEHSITPESAVSMQEVLGADIIMVLDVCPGSDAGREKQGEAMAFTARWAERCRNAHKDSGQHLFGIIQGGIYSELRRAAAEQITSLDFPGYAIGGLSVGESKQDMESMLAHQIAYLPQDRPRYLMGVGYPEDILMAVSYGIDMFDCVLPTRNARTGNVFTSEGQIVYRNAEYADDDRPLDVNCDCKVCRRYSRAYIRHLYNQSEITGMVLATYHSTYFYQNLMRGIREAIAQQRFDSFRSEFLARYTQGVA